jgi:hypothetical protein
MKDKLPYGSVIYVSGPMTGLPCFNFKSFFYWQVMLEKSGYKVINPAEQDCLKMLNEGWQYSPDKWEEVIEEDCQLIRDEADAVFVMDGYITSEGAHREISTAVEAGKPVFYETEQEG